MDTHNIIKGQDSDISIKPGMQAFLLNNALHHSIDRSRFAEKLPDYFNTITREIDDVVAQRLVWQLQLDAYSKERREKGLPEDPAADLAFMHQIGYIPLEVDGRTSIRGTVDPEIKTPGLESVSPLMNDNMALGGANGRWQDYARVLRASNLVNGPNDWEGISRKIFDLLQYVPLNNQNGQPASWENVIDRAVVNGKLVLTMRDGTQARLEDPQQFVGYTGTTDKPTSIVFKHNGLHIEPKFDDRDSPLFRANQAKISGLDVEANVTGIEDLEDGSSIVGEKDELRAYNVRLQLDKGTFAFQRAGEETIRRMADDRPYLAPDGTPITLRARTLMQTRVRGLLMKTDTILDKDGRPVHEFPLDMLAVALAGKHDIEKADGELRNSVTRNIYVVVPKPHGPEDVRLIMKTKRWAEDLCELPKHTIKIFLMDEDPRTSLTLEQCFAEGIDPDDGINDIIITNTGFLDWTGQYAHTFLEKGEIAPKGVIRISSICLPAYEENNVFTSIKCGLDASGKGMATLTKRTDVGLASKYAHAEAGANATWPHSPMAGGAYVEVFHKVDVTAIREKMAAEIANMSDDELARKRDEYRLRILTFPFAQAEHLTPEAVRAELADNVHGELAYAKPWVDNGDGCVAVQNKAGDEVMEDCATELISTGMVRSRLHYSRTTPEEVLKISRMEAAEVDARNSGTANYRPLTDGFDENPAAQAINRMNLTTDRSDRNVQPHLYPAREKARAALTAG